MIDLPRMVEYEVDGVGIDTGAGASTARRSYGAVKNRGKGARAEMDEKVVALNEKSAEGRPGSGSNFGFGLGEDLGAEGGVGGEGQTGAKDVKHYDADGEWMRLW